MLARQMPSTILLALAAAHQVAGFAIALYQGRQCRGGGVAKLIAGPDAGCLTGGTGIASSAVVLSTGPVDDAFSITFFSSSTCDPSTELWHSVDIIYGDEDTNSACFAGLDSSTNETANFLSYQVWDLSKLDDEE